MGAGIHESNQPQSARHTGLVLLVLITGLVAAVFLANKLTAGWQLDLTETDRYTLSPGSIAILENMDQTVTVRLFESESATAELPQLRSYALQVRELLQALRAHSNDRLDVRFINPEPFSDAEDQAMRYGLQPVPIQDGNTLYFGIAATNDLDGLQVMPFLNPDKARFLEYDLVRMIAGLSRPERPRLELLSSLPVYDEQGEPRWAIYQQWQQRYDLEILPPESPDAAPAADRRSDLLVVIHPAGLMQEWIPLIQAHVEQGGQLLLFVDPLAETFGDEIPALSGQALSGLLDTFGLGYDPGLVVGDLQYALQIGRGAGQSPVRLLTAVGIGKEHLSDTDILTADLDQVNFSSAGFLESFADIGELRHEVLISTSANAAPIPVERIRQLQDPEDLRQGFNPTGESYPLAVRITGTGGRALQVVVIADTDMLADRMWVQRQNVLGQTLLEPFADNGNLAVSAVDNLMGDDRLISLRARAMDRRPFTRVQRLRAEAGQQLRASEERLESQLADTEQRLAELQSSRSDDQLAVLDADQQQALDSFLQQRLDIRRQLREVRRNLDLEIRRLEARLKFFNIVLVPGLVAMLGGILFYRRRRRQDR